jgi:hypothetical protein
VKDDKLYLIHISECIAEGSIRPDRAQELVEQLRRDAAE